MDETQAGHLDGFFPKLAPGTKAPAVQPPPGPTAATQTQSTFTNMPRNAYDGTTAVLVQRVPEIATQAADSELSGRFRGVLAMAREAANVIELFVAVVTATHGYGTQTTGVYDPRRGPVATIRASMFQAEGLGRNTGLVLDEIGPRRIAPTECARIHGFATAACELANHYLAKRGGWRQ